MTHYSYPAFFQTDSLNILETPVVLQPSNTQDDSSSLQPDTLVKIKKQKDTLKIANLSKVTKPKDDSLITKNNSSVIEKSLLTTLPSNDINDSLTKPHLIKNESLATQIQLQNKLPENKIHIQNREYWIPSVILFSLLTIVWARNSHSNRFVRMLKAFFNIREFYQVVREEYAMVNSLSIGMALLFILVQSVFLYQVNSFYSIVEPTSKPFLFFIKITLVVFLFFAIKLLIIRILGFVFYGKTDSVSDFVYNIFLMNNISGIVLIPIVIFIAYFDVIPKSIIIPTSSIILTSIYLYRTLRAFNLSLGNSSVSRLYFFVYLCTLEFLPFVVIFKVIVSRF